MGKRCYELFLNCGEFAIFNNSMKPSMTELLHTGLRAEGQFSPQAGE